jgi:hypothetical protein
MSIGLSLQDTPRRRLLPALAGAWNQIRHHIAPDRDSAATPVEHPIKA